jgi:hypothetical protein
MTALTQRDIAKLIGEAGAAHGVHEERDLHGVRDEAWAVWYAGYLVEHGIGDLLGQTITTEQLALLLARYDEDYRAQQRKEGWPEYYAAQLLEWRDAPPGQADLSGARRPR